VTATAQTDDAGDDPLRDRLVAAAAEVLSERGWDGARVQEIARRAGVTTGAIYSRFPGKAALLVEAIDARSRAELDALFSREPGHGTAGLATMGVHLVDQRPGARALLLEAIVAARRDPEIARLVAGEVEAQARPLAGLVDAGKADRTVDPALDTEAIVRFSHAVGLGFLLYDALDITPPAPEPWQALIARLVAALAPPPDADPAPDA
jgi:AcrR family transcriptional regulator